MVKKTRDIYSWQELRNNQMQTHPIIYSAYHSNIYGSKIIIIKKNYELAELQFNKGTTMKNLHW